MAPILGIDYGSVRIGVAVSDELRMLAHPVETIPTGTNAVRRIAEIVRDKKAESVIVGVPRMMSGALGQAAEHVQIFIEKLRGALSCPIIPWDERLTTVAAQRALRDAGKSTRASRSYVDQVAAQMILQGYLDSRAVTEPMDEMPELD